MPAEARRRARRRSASQLGPRRSTSTTWSTALRLARELRAVVRRGQGRASSCYSAAGPGRHRSLMRARLRRVLRPEAARHPDDGRARPARVLGALGATLPHAARRAAASPCCSAGVEGLPRRGRARPGCRRRSRWRSPCSRATTDAPPHILAASGCAGAVEAGCGGIVCAAVDVREATPAARRGCVAGGARHPAGRRRRARPGARRPRRRGRVEAGADLLVVGRAVTAGRRPGRGRRRGGELRRAS